MSYVIFQINTDLLVIYQLSTFLHKGLYIYIYIEKILVLFFANVFRKIHIIPHFHYFQQWVRFAIFQINTKFVKNQLKSIFTQDNLHLSLISTKKTFLPHFHYFQQYLSCVIFQINTDFLINQLKKSFYARDFTLLFNFTKNSAVNRRSF